MTKPGEYVVCCCNCHTTENLQMFAHRAVAGRIVGWLFACEDCTSLIMEAGQITINIGERDDQPEP